MFSWLIMPRWIGLPVAFVGSSGTYSARDDVRAHARRSSEQLPDGIELSEAFGSGSLHDASTEPASIVAATATPNNPARLTMSPDSAGSKLHSTPRPATATGPGISEMNTV